MIKVVKFGGSSVANSEQFQKVKKIVTSDPSRKFVVTSACGKSGKDDHKVTDLLYLCAAHINYGVSYESIFALINEKYTEIKDSGYGIDGWKIGNQFNQLVHENQDNNVWEQTKKLNDEANKSKLLGFWFDDSKVKAQISAIASISGEYGALSNGSRDSTEFLDEMIRRYKEAGMEEIKAEADRQLSEFLSKNK